MFNGGTTRNLSNNHYSTNKSETSVQYINKT